eukprot:765981-Hanusia_phi.AAC.4
MALCSEDVNFSEMDDLQESQRPRFGPLRPRFRSSEVPSPPSLRRRSRPGAARLRLPSRRLASLAARPGPTGGRGPVMVPRPAAAGVRSGEGTVTRKDSKRSDRTDSEMDSGRSSRVAAPTVWAAAASEVPCPPSLGVVRAPGHARPVQRRDGPKFAAAAGRPRAAAGWCTAVPQCVPAAGCGEPLRRSPSVSSAAGRQDGSLWVAKLYGRAAFVLLSLLRQFESFSTSPIVPELPAPDLIIKIALRWRRGMRSGLHGADRSRRVGAGQGEGGEGRGERREERGERREVRQEEGVSWRRSRGEARTRSRYNRSPPPKCCSPCCRVYVIHMYV